MPSKVSGAGTRNLHGLERDGVWAFGCNGGREAELLVLLTWTVLGKFVEFLTTLSLVRRFFDS